MSSTAPFPAEGSEQLEWARLIPGESPSYARYRKKSTPSAGTIRPSNIRELSTGASDNLPRSALKLLLPAPLLSRKAQTWLRATATDFALVGMNWLLIGAFLVTLSRDFPRFHLQRYEGETPIFWLGIGLLHAALITLIGHSEGLYESARSLPQQARRLGKSTALATVILGFAYGFQRSIAITIPVFCCAALLHFGVLWVWRRHAGKRKSPDRGSRDFRNVLIVGAGATGRRIAASLSSQPADGRVLYGLLDDELPLGNGVIGRVRDLARLARRGFVDEVILAAPRERSLTQRIVREAEQLRLDVEIVPEMFGCKIAENEFDRVDDLPMIYVHAEQLPAAGLVIKRTIDVIGAGMALLILSPVLAMIALLIKLDSKGPILYCAQRAGRKGRLFRCFKFRTMVCHAAGLKEQLRQRNERTGPIFKIADDPRITWAGQFLRRYSLDELPQLWNVLRGDMSLVGPRPHPADDYAAYELEHLARLDVTPGITGLWQVTARRDPSFERAMELDREYIRTWSLASDARILAKTVLAVVRGSGQ